MTAVSSISNRRKVAKGESSKKKYFVGGLAFYSLFSLNTVVPGEPRTFLIEARYKF